MRNAKSSLHTSDICIHNLYELWAWTKFAMSSFELRQIIFSWVMKSNVKNILQGEKEIDSIRIKNCINPDPKQDYL